VDAQPTDETGRPATTVAAWDAGLDLTDPAEVYAFRLRAAIFGHNAPDWRTMPDVVRKSYAATVAPDAASTFDQAAFDAARFAVDETSPEWPGFSLTDADDGQDAVLELDAAYPAILPGSWLLLRAPDVPDQLYQVVRADLSAAADFGLTATTTRLRLRGVGRLSRFGRRATAVYAQSERLELAETPLTAPVTGPELALDRPAELPPGALVVVTGTTADGLPFAEAARVASVTADGPTLTAPLSSPLDPASVRILGNVVEATAGQTTEQVLGSGDGGAINQRFTLPHKNLTHTPAPTPRGVRDSLEVRVDGVAWTEADSLFSLGPHDRSYVVRIDDDAEATVVFGDGERGARLPSGQENVSATYRVGAGPGGNVAAGALSLLMTRPLGISGVGNPLPASGGAAAERLEDARSTAALTVRTLDRVVSLTDHEDFARAFAGIAKARAVALRVGSTPLVHVTVAAPGGGEMSGTTRAALKDALGRAGSPLARLDLGDYRRPTFAVTAEILVAADRRRDAVSEAVVAAVRAAYSFERRDFAEPVTAAELLTVVQRVPGVAAANLTALHLTGDDAGSADVLIARGARLVPSADAGRVTVAPAELLTVDPAGITVREMAP
jgi:predicted phage baseplate assembly protein